MMDNPEECKICFENFDEIGQRPRTLPCGHTFCSPCIGDTIKCGQLACPGCRAPHSATHPTQFPINYGMEALVRKLKAVKMVQVSTEILPSAPPLPNESIECIGVSFCNELDLNISHANRNRLQMQTVKTSSYLTANQEIQSQMDQYRAKLDDWRTEHLQLVNRLSNLVEKNKAALDLLKHEDTRVLAMKREGEEGEKQLKARLIRLNAVKTTLEVISTIDNPDYCNTEHDKWMLKCQELIPDINTVTNSKKVREASRVVVETRVEVGTAQASGMLEDVGSTIMQRVKTIEQDGSLCVEELTFEELRRMKQPIKKLLEAGRVYGVQHDQGNFRSSKITLENGQLHFHCLLNQPTPPTACTLPVSDVLESLDPSSTLVFLDLAWEGSPRRRVYIRLNPDTPLARQFCFLCIGVRGYSFINSTFLEVCGFRRQGEFVMGGDYEHNDGSGGASLLPDLQGDYRTSGRAGAVWSRYGESDPRNSQFAITTRNCKGNIPRVFGMVEHGMEVVRAAVNHTTIKEVTVVDCGVVLGRGLLNM